MDIARLVKGAVDENQFRHISFTSVANMEGATGNPKWGTSAADDNWEDDWEDIADASNRTQPSTSPTQTPPRPPKSSPSKNGTPMSNKASPPPSDKKPTEDSLRTELDAALKRIKTTDLKLFAVTRERDSLRRGRDLRSSEALLLKQKDDQIKAVLAEGEKLSIKIAEKETSVRSLKSRIADLENILEDRNNAVGAAEARAEAARTRERAAETAQRAATDAREAAEKRVRALESGASTQSAVVLDAARADLDAAKRAAANALRATEARLANTHEVAMAKQAAAAEAREAALSKALDELRDRLVDDAGTADAREERLRRDVTALRERASALETRNEELAAEVPNATRPLLRQIEALQAASAERSRAAKAAERTLASRAHAADAAAAAAAERERASDERVAVLEARMAALQEQVRIARAATDATENELVEVKENAAADCSALTKNLRREAERVRQLSKERDEALADVRSERAAALDAADAAETLGKELREKIAALEAKLELARDSPTTPGARPASGLSSARNSLSEIAALVAGTPGSMPASPHLEENVQLPPSGSIHNGLYATERMAATLRQRIGEAQSLHKQLYEKEKGNKALAEEVVSLTGRLDELSRQVKDAPSIKKRLDELEQRHITLLELLGEREERIGELEADLVDVKDMSKSQVNELLMRLEHLQAAQ